MTKAETQPLRGFDSFSVRLGDELRGERASRGKSLLDVQRELRIKAAHIDAIENANPAGIPHAGYIPGYIRSYARYLELDEAETLRRFCEESGFVPQTALGGGRGQGGLQGGGSVEARTDLDAVIAGSRLAAVSRTETFNGELGATLRGLCSLSILVVIVAGLGYGSWTLLQNIQRVDFSPLPEAPTALASVPGLDVEPADGTRPWTADTPIELDAIAAVYAVQQLAPPEIDRRDGPISTIDPSHAGIYGRDQQAVALRESEAVVLPSLAERPALPSGDVLAAAPALPSERTAQASAGVVPASANGVALVIASEAWLRVRNADGRTVHEALMQPGARWDAPDRAAGLTLRAGNAAGVYVEVDGVIFGPLGNPGEVVSGVSLEPAAVRKRYTLPAEALTTSALDETVVQAR